MSTTHIEIETVDQLRAAAPNLAGQVVQGVDLTGCSNLLRHCDVSTTIFLGCSTSARLAAWLRARGALIFPAIPGSHSIPTTRAPTQRRNCTTTSARGTTSPWTLPSTDGAAAWPLRHDCATPSPLLCMTTP